MIHLNNIDDAIEDVQWIARNNLRGGILLPLPSPSETPLKPLNHPDVLGPMLLLFLAPEANIISIYSNDRRKPALMVMEGPFGTPPQAPSAEELYEAIYCSVKGATPEEEEQSGRCLHD